jgi:hypothetical protein
VIRALALLTIVCCAATLRAAPASQPAADRVAALIGKLAGGTPSQRRQARDELVQIGRGAVPQLQAAAQSAGDPETRSAAEVILKRIAAHDEFGPTLITLHVRGTGPEIFDAIAKQAGIRFEPRANDTWPKDKPLPSISVDFDRIPFWEAVARAGEQCGVRPTGEYRHSKLDDPNVEAGVEIIPGEIQLERIDAQSGRNSAATFSGPFYVYGKASAAPHAKNRLSFRMFAIAEPKLRPVFWSVPSVKATDDKGKALTMLSMDAIVPMWGRTPEVGIEFATAGPASRIAEFRADTQVLVAASTQKLEVGDLAKAKGTVWLWNGIRIEIEGFELMKDGAYRLMLNLTRGNLDEAHFQECYYVIQSVPTQLVDASDRPLLRDASSMSLPQMNGAPADHIRVFQTFIRDTLRDADPKPGPPIRLVWELPTQLHSYDVPVALKDLSVR